MLCSWTWLWFVGQTNTQAVSSHSLSPFGLMRTGGCLYVVLPHSPEAYLCDTAAQPQTRFPSLSLATMTCACFMLVVFWSCSFLHAKGAAGKGIFFLWVGESSILHNLSPFSASPHQIAILGSHVTCNKAPFHHRNMPINKFYIFFSSAAHHRSNFSK